MVKLATPKFNIVQRKKAKQAAVLDRQTGLRSFPSDKGFFNGSCNRSACLKPGANWYNHGSLAYYCQSCASELNYDHFNRKDALDNWGHLLCTEGEYNREKFEKLHDLHRNSKLFMEQNYTKGQIGQYVPDAGEFWSTERNFTVRENTPKNSETINVKLFNGEETTFPMKKVSMSNRSIRLTS